MGIDTNNTNEISDLDLGIGKILKRTNTGLVMGENGFTFVDETGKNKTNPYLEKEIGMGKIQDIFSDGRIVFENGICLVDTDSFKVTPLFFADFGIKGFKEFRSDGILISENMALCFDLDTQEYLYNANIENIGNITEIEKSAYFVKIHGDEGFKLINLFNSNDQETLYKDLGIGSEYEIKKSIFRKDKGFMVLGNQGVVKLNSVGEVAYKIGNDTLLGIIKGISEGGNVFGDKAIAKIGENGEFEYIITAEDMGMDSITTFGSGKIIGKDKKGKGQVARVNTNTGKILYRSADLSESTINELAGLGINDIDRFGSERFIDHIIDNREDIESLGDKEIILMVQPKSDHNGAFSVDNHELFMQSQDVIYYEIATDGQLEDVFKELKERLPEGASISHFILGGHGSQKSIQLSQNWQDYDGSHVDLSDAEQFEKYADLFKNTKSIILKSCSTGKGGLKGNNILNMIASSFGKYTKSIVAPKVPTNNLYSFIPDRLGSGYLFFDGPLYHSNNLTMKSGENYVDEK